MFFTLPQLTIDGEVYNTTGAIDGHECVCLNRTIHAAHSLAPPEHFKETEVTWMTKNKKMWTVACKNCNKPPLSLYCFCLRPTYSSSRVWISKNHNNRCYQCEKLQLSDAARNRIFRNFCPQEMARLDRINQQNRDDDDSSSSSNVDDDVAHPLVQAMERYLYL